MSESNSTPRSQFESAEEDGDEESYEEESYVDSEEEELLDDDVDHRLEFINSYLSKSLRLKTERWNKMVSNDEYMGIIYAFFDDPTIKKLIIYISTSGSAIPSFTMPDTALKSKAAYFLRRRDEPITNKNYKHLILPGDIAPKPVDELFVLLDEIFTPLVNNPLNTSRWPNFIVEDVQKHVTDFRNKVRQIQGAITGEIVLPMPDGIEKVFQEEEKLRESNGREFDMKFKRNIETIVLKWAKIVNDILSDDPLDSFDNNAHPTPLVEIGFWKRRLQYSISIYEQLNDIRIKKMATILELTESVYLMTFKEIFKKIIEAVTEARDINLFLKPLVRHFEQFEQTEFLDCKLLIKPMLHCVGLLWSNSKFYCQNSRISVLFRQISNLLIEECTKQLDPSSILQGDPEENFNKIQKAIDIFKFYRETFDENSKNISKFYRDSQDIIPWSFHPNVIFDRHNEYLAQLELLQTFFSTVIEYFRLEKVEIGGLKGRYLSSNISNVLDDFQRMLQNFFNIPCDPLDITDSTFKNEFKQFLEDINHLDIKLASYFAQAFDDCSNLESVFKLINIIGVLIERPKINQAITSRYKKILTWMNKNLDTVKTIFDESVNETDLAIDNLFPPTAGALVWIKKLKDRIAKPMEEFKNLENDINKTTEALYMEEKHNEIMNSLNGYESKKFSEWFEKVPELISQHMNKPLLNHDSKMNLLGINFHEELKTLLREVKYLKMFEIENLPIEAIELFERVEELHECLTKLYRICEWYNFLRTKTSTVEFDMINLEVDFIDKLIEEIILTLTWNSNNTMEAIIGLFESVKVLHDRVKKAQSNIKRLLDKIDIWGNEYLFVRKTSGDYMLKLDDRIEQIENRYVLVRDSLKEIYDVLNENYNLYFDITEVEEEEEEEDLLLDNLELMSDTISKKSEKKKTSKKKAKTKKIQKSKKESMKTIQSTKSKDTVEDKSEIISKFDNLGFEKIIELRKVKWDRYLEYIDEEVTKHLINACIKSISLFYEEMDPDANKIALFEIIVKLKEPDFDFEPKLEIDRPNGIYQIITQLIEDISYQCNLVIRVDKSKQLNDYRSDLDENIEYKKMVLTIMKYIVSAITKVRAYFKEFLKYKYLWIDDREEYLKTFLLYSRQLTDDEKFSQTLENAIPIEEKIPEIDDYKQQIDFFEDLYEEVNKIEENKIFDCWLKVNLEYLRQSILNYIRKWGNLFTDHLISFVKLSLNELEEFINEAMIEMQKEVKEGDYDGLVNVMKYLIRVRERTETTDSMFEPIKEIIEFLRNYRVEFSEDVYIQLQELPDRWSAVKRMCLSVKQNLLPLINQQVVKIKKRLQLFEIIQQQYRANFLKKPFWEFSCKNIYHHLDETHIELSGFEEKLADLVETCDLFEVLVPEYPHLQLCRKDLCMMKTMWDFINIVMSCIDEWKDTLWNKIDVEAMEMECKKFAKDVKLLDKEIRNWEIYRDLESHIKNMLSSLRAVTELQNPAIRDRHWDQLMLATKVKFQMNDSTTLADLLDLNLHKYEDDVKNIVDKSVKEMSMEKVLKELKSTWANMDFEFELHERSKAKVLKISEDLVEILEDNQVQIQNMMSSKFVSFFLEEVTMWQKKLSNADQVIAIWQDVQRKWMYLEAIFIGSEDIRKQLPEDSKRFDRIDKQFRLELLNEMSRNSNVVKATNTPGLYNKLETLLADLVLCEKALNDYLETKRLTYPRFYFVSSADLLDILSNGNYPELVCRHLIKLYDSIANLKFSKEGDKISKKAKTMIAKDGEVVQLKAVCDCSGKVEIWLNRVTDAMRFTIHALFSEAIITYEEKPREGWIFDWPAQVALVGSQIWWTNEVNLAFSMIEEGYENAMKDYQRKQITQLNALINLLLGELTAGNRQKIMTICTIDVHQRDVVFKMIQLKIDSVASFQWQCQLRHRWDTTINNCFGNICDAQFLYQFEYLGCTPRLVITPLTDRCYITLTQSLHLVMGGAPAGPAGTGKTETTKDLGRALGVMVYVFNCSEQMDYKSIGNIYKGLAQTGAWGCFDEFNRISIEVLSVVAVQVKCILDAIKLKKKRFLFLDQEVNLIPTVGIFITMNPGYAGRTELPENLKALFRPCAMVVPDFELICEIMLIAEGFQEARILARKFITLYTLCRELLSKQDHYDWGLRAIKSVLVVAGSLKRGDRQRPEDQVLMRALRDFNIPKIITDDLPVFMGLIGDLFPALDVPRKRDFEFEKIVKKSAVDLKLQPEDNFILKVVQLEELLAVRHSVFIVGFAGTGKTQVWKTLFKTYQNQKRKPIYNDLDPKAVTTDELFGVINRATREWKDGLISVIMRDQANLGGTGPKWIVLDGDIDPMWIESLNTVMDDNKVLTLASNERIALTQHMRLLFEISNLRTATPATVSRAGILYINPQDLGWNPYVASWIDKRPTSEQATLLILFEKYVPPCLEQVAKKLKKITPIPDIAHIEMLCFLIECLLTPNNVPNDCPKEWYEIYFVFACIWAFGSSLFQDQIIDWRNEFHKWWVNEFKTVRFPPQGTVFNYYIDPETKKFLPWKEMVKNFELDVDIPLQATLVDTEETARYRFFLDMLIEKNVPIMLVGGAGSGKSVIVNSKLANLSENYSITNVPFNFYTTSEMLQQILEKPLEKKAGRNYGPPGSKTMIYFIDDMNMPEVDTYGTVQPHTIMRQYLDYHHWYDRTKLTLKDIHNIQFVSCMNPTSGSFTVDSRLQRHFCVFAISYPSLEICQNIYSLILRQHLMMPMNKFNPDILKMCDPLVNASILLHQKISQTYLPTVIKFHYTFNLRDLSNIYQAMLFANGDCVKTESELLRLYIHEATRVYSDKLVSKEDVETFNKILKEIIKKYIESDIEEDVVYTEPNIYCHFAEGIGDPKYMFVNNGWNQIQNILNEALATYNDLIGAMNLVLFEDAIYHICRINRILESPRGNALLVGVGGSGKQSLARLSAFISSLEVFQVQLRKGYSIADLKIDFNSLYMKTGIKSLGIMFLMTDSQVADEKFLVVINDILASGEIPELFSDDEVENIIGSVRNEVKGAGLLDTKENCWKFFIDRVRRQLKVVLCFSPVGSTLRVRARKFPAIVNCTSIDWFHEWPLEALESVSKRFLSDLEVLPEHLVHSISKFMSYVHVIVNDVSQAYLLYEKRYNYTTPKSFLEQIELYSKLLRENVHQVLNRIERLENGLEKLRVTATEVDTLKETLKVQEVEVTARNNEAQKLIEVVSQETEKVSAERELAFEEEKKVRIIEEEVAVKQKICAEDLAKAEPAIIAAQEALNTLNKNNLTELKSFGAPPPAVVNVLAAVLVLFSKKGKIPKDRSWKACKLLMGKVDQFLSDLINYDKENIHPDVVKAIQPYINDPNFDPEFIKSKSIAAAGICAWVINIMKFYDIFVIVEPKRRALIKATEELNDARNRLEELNKKLQYLEEQFSVLTNELNIAIAAKEKVQAQADLTSLQIDLANRLVNGLASENVRWRETVVTLKAQGETLPGDVLIVTAFISYVGCFTKRYRIELMEKYWLPFLDSLEIPIPKSSSVDPLAMLSDDAQIAQWNNEGLPSDRMSAENATILTHSARWPLIIDPQLQGIKWIKNKYGDALTILRLTQRNYLDRLEKAISNGEICLIENIGETVDAVLDPVLGRQLIKKGKFIKIGDKEIDFNPKFRLILHTKLANPHYKPEMQAQTTLINFTVTRDGLEDQLLAEVVKAERPDLEELRTDLTTQQNHFKITLKRCEDNLLYRLSSASGNILGDVELVENLETTKKTAADIVIKSAEAKVTSIKIDEAREIYRPAAERASLLYFILNDLYKINPMYQFSLKAFSVVFNNAIAAAETTENIKARVSNLLDSITFYVFIYTSRGLFKSDKLIFLAQIALQISQGLGEINSEELDFLLRFPTEAIGTSPVDFLTDHLWRGVKRLSKLDEFNNLDKDIEGAAKRWKNFVESEAPEREKFPQEWKNKNSLQRLCMMRTLRPDRMTYALSVYIEEQLGTKYTEARATEFSKSFKESSPTTTIFFILSPGVDPLKDVEKLGKKLGYSTENNNFHNVSLGQGQEEVAENAMDIASEHGHWVILQNIHLVAKWLPTLEKKMEQCWENPHENYRLFISAEPAPSADYHIIPQGVLESAIKITTEPPTGMLANLHKALDNFNQETLEMCTKEAEFKAILFSLCYFHAVVCERRKFGPQGWNRVYPFNEGDLSICVYVLYNYLENNLRIPWEDLRYLFGEIMYGGHITDDWDRRLCRTFLQEYMQSDLVDGELFLAPNFLAPPNLDYTSYHKYIDDMLPPENPHLYGLHSNAEIGFLTTTSENLFRTIFELQPRDSSASSQIVSKEDKIKGILEDIYDKLPELYNLPELMARVEDKTPFVLVAFQECERMNNLVNEMRVSLKELDLGLKGELTISKNMEDLQECLFFDKVPPNWEKKAYPSLLPLGAWYNDLQVRMRELEAWANDFSLPPTIWLSGFFNPQSFLTAIMQQTARKNEWPLDKMCLNCDVTRKQREEFTAPPREGAYIYGLYMEGAKWDMKLNSIINAQLKELFPMMPVIYLKAITQDKQDLKNIYECPVYKTRQRGPTYVWTFNLKTREKASKWIMAGVALILQI